MIRNDGLWIDEIFLGLRINPVAHRLLNEVPSIHIGLQENSIIKAMRLGATLFIIGVKKKSFAYPGSPTTSYWSSLLDSIGNTRADFPMLIVPALCSLNLWLLVLYAITVANHDDQDGALRLIVQIMCKQNIYSWEVVMQKVRSMPWISCFEEPCSRLAEKLR